MAKTKEDAAAKVNLLGRTGVRILDLSVLQVDGSYQRAVKTGHKKIMADFNEDALGIPLVGEREDGSLWIVDGLQRVTALSKLGKTKARFEVFRSQGPEHEAQVFRLVNMGRTKLNTAEQFRALLAGGDKLAWAIKEEVERQGFILNTNHGRTSSAVGEKQILCLRTLLQVSADQGTAPIAFALRCIDAAWPGDRMGMHNGIIAGLCLFFKRNSGKDGLIDLERMINRLQMSTPQKVLYASSQATISNNLENAVCDQLDKLYRRRVGKRQQ